MADNFEQFLEDGLFENKTILVTGGSGTIGSEIVNQLLRYNPKIIRVFSNDENGLFNLQQQLPSQKNLRFLFGDIRDKDRVRMACDGVDIVFHAAALKHVPICEYNPFEAVRTNVIGTQNLIESALIEDVERLIFISTDKAVNPTSTMGASKLLCEKLVVEASSYRGRRRTIFTCVRFGNVLGSRGSVTEVFKNQIALGSKVTITHPEVTRFVMLTSQAVGLVFKAVEKAKGGEIFILKMPSLKVIDLAEVMIEALNGNAVKPSIEFIGLRPGEKIHEELLTETEVRNSIELPDMFIVNSHDYTTTNYVCRKSYSSNDQAPMSKGEIFKMLKMAKIV